MKYPEYLESAERHLVSCRKFFDSIKWENTAQEKDVLKEEEKILKDQKSLKECKTELSIRKKRIKKNAVLLLEYKKKWIDKLEILLIQAPFLEKKISWLKRRDARLEQYQTLLIKKMNQFKSDEQQQNLQTDKRFISFLKKMKNWMGELEALLTLAPLFEQQISWLKQRGNRLEQCQTLLIKKMNQFKSDEIQLKQKETSLKRQLEKIYLLRDIYYLTGYILEGIAVYLVYGAGGFDPQKNIKEFDRRFTERTGVDFFSFRGRNTTRTENISEEDQKWLNSQEDICGVNQHHFNDLIDRYHNRLSISSNKIPYVDNPNDVSKPVRELIKHWDASHRYSDYDSHIPWKIHRLRQFLNRDTLSKLIDIYSQIVNTVNKVEFSHLNKGNI